MHWCNEMGSDQNCYEQCKIRCARCNYAGAWKSYWRDNGGNNGNRKPPRKFPLHYLIPGYTMASVLANEFTEATSDLYLNALIELALVLFVITIIINIFARLLVWSTEENGS